MGNGIFWSQPETSSAASCGSGGGSGSTTMPSTQPSSSTPIALLSCCSAGSDGLDYCSALFCSVMDWTTVLPLFCSVMWTVVLLCSGLEYYCTSVLLCHVDCCSANCRSGFGKVNTLKWNPCAKLN
ncbi:hypothetical protein RHMOL_Rhmol06G0153300 [Rhododendron molle]|uniref:Uncharacterized protein n=1 Tax=Rhododendron molle TaxID=49168 RepID=A0ACC0NCQ2_RHOML|nr:hypothetical protein RHMOL_Rhmol06G0153300 [Rhododendron molle]